MAEPCGYDVIVDRISHDIPFYRAWLKNAVLSGTRVINNPFWWSADDKFFNYALAHEARRGGAADRDAAAQGAPDRAPPISRCATCTTRSTGTRSSSTSASPPSSSRSTAAAGATSTRWTRPRSSSRPTTRRATLCMTLQRGVDFNEYFRCYVVGQEKVHIMPYDPRQPFHERYVKNPPAYDQALLDRVERDCADAVPRARLRPQHGGVRGRGRHPLRHRLHEPGAGCRPALGGPGQLRLDRQRRGRPGGQEGASSRRPRADYRWAAFLKG